MGRLDGKVIVLTAAAQGIGWAAALVKLSSSVACLLTFEVPKYQARYRGYLVLLFFFFFFFPFMLLLS